MNWASITFDWALLNDIVQIAILYFVFYWILRAARGSRFGQVLTGVGLLFAALIAFTYLFHFDVLSRLVQGLLFYLALSTVVIFQPEIRRFLATIGSLIFQDRNRFQTSDGAATPEAIVDALIKLANRQMGALVAFERGISLRGFESSGVRLDALFSPELLLTIFTEPKPLHDGGVVIRHGRVSSAHCVFPVSAQKELSVSGMRHRAGVGLSEETDALVIIISEERQQISVARNGHLVRYPDLGHDTRAALVKRIRKAMPQNKNVYDTISEWLRKHGGRADRLLGRVGLSDGHPDQVASAAVQESVP